MDNAYNYRLQTDLPAVDLDESVASALDALAEIVEAGHSGEEIQGAIYDTAREYDIEISDLFEAGYRLFFDETQGPRLGEFLGELETEFVVGRLRRER
jgi:lysyl-tRNA synthetase class 1